MKYFGLGLLIVLFLLGSCGITTYNGLAGGNQNVTRAVADVQADMQRKVNVLTEAVQNLNASARFERGTMDDVVRGRAAAGGVINLNPADIANSPQLQQQLFQQQQNLSSVLGRLMVVVERYPDLRTTVLFQHMHDTIEGSENRITHSRQVWNQATSDYNTAVQSFPGNIVVQFSPFPRHRDFFTPTAALPETVNLQYDNQTTTSSTTQPQQ